MGVLRTIREILTTPREQLALLDWPSDDIKLSIRDGADRQRLSSCAKEPETVAWLRTHAQPGAVFYDVGANVGAYSLIAAALLKGKGAVYGFEPGFANFASLSRNILHNNFSKIITPIHVALDSKEGFLSMSFSSTESGAAKHIVANAPVEGSETLRVPALSLDFLRATLQLPSPTMLKIDVDGGEHGVVEGARETLLLPSLRSVLIEIDEQVEGAKDISNLITSAGFSLSQKHPREKGKSETLFNCIFERA